MPLQALSLGPEIDVWRPQTGAVHSAFEHALNLLMDGELWTVLAAGRQDAPFGIRLASADPAGGLAVRPADPVHVRAGFMRVGPQVVDCRAAGRWAPAPWAMPAPGLDARVSFVEREARSRAWSGSEQIARDLTQALRSSDVELARVVRRSIGLGPGLTPAGDDVLVGMLAVLTSGAAAALPIASRLRGALAPVLHLTSDVSRHLLSQAARGLPGRSLHELGRSLLEGAPEHTLARALARVLDTGCTSGGDACTGLAAACHLSLLPSESVAS
jgi:Protein of unknown function (DUF2877)